MSVQEIKRYQIGCDFCEATEIIERAEGGSVIFLVPPKPAGWKNTRYNKPRYSSLGQGGGSIDQCSACLDKEVVLPDDAIDIRTTVY